VGQAQPRVTGTTQQLNESVSAVASGTGTATFTFQSPPQGLVWTGTLSCGSAPATASFLAMIGATNWGTWGGDSVAGPVQAYANQQLVVTATGLTAGLSYDLIWAGSSDEPSGIQPVFPDVNASALSVALATTQGIVDFLGSNQSAVFSASPSTPVPTVTALHSYLTIMVLILIPGATPPAITAQTFLQATSTTFSPQTQTPVPFLGGTPVATFLLPIAVAPGQLFDVLITASGTATGSIYLYGLSTTMTEQVVAPVGNPLSVAIRGGTLLASHTFVGAGSVALLPAPAAGFAYRLQRLTQGDTASFANLTGTTSGAIYGFAAAIVVDNLDGLISAEGLTLSSGAALTATLFYDVIPAPTIS
jgi:hypothetical protein